MSSSRSTLSSRRRAILAAAGAGALALATLAGCGGGEEAASGGREAAKARALAAAPMSPSPLEREFRLKGAEPVDAERFFAVLPPELRPEIGASVFDGASGATVLTDVVFPAARFRGEGAVEYDVAFDGLRIDRLELYGADSEALDAVAKGEPSLDAPMRRILTKARAYGVRGPRVEDRTPGERVAAGESSESDAVVAAIEIDGLSAREGGLPPLAAGANAEGAGLARLLYAFAVDGFYLKDMTVVARDQTAEGAPLFETTAPDVRIVGLADGRLEAFVVNGFRSVVRAGPETAVEQAAAGVFSPVTDILTASFEAATSPEERRTSVERFEWRGADASKMLPFALSGATPPTSVRDLFDLGSIEVRNAETYVDGRLFSSAPLSEVSAMEFDWLAPSKIRARSNGVFYDFTALFPPEREDARSFLKGLALDGVTSDTTLAYDWKAGDGAARFDAAAVAEGLAATRASADIVGMRLSDVDSAAAAEGGADALFDAASLAGFEFTAKDEAALDAMFGLMALEGGAGSGAARNGTVALLRFAGLQLGFIDPRFGVYTNALADFLQQGGTLTIVAAPPAPVPLADLDGLEGADVADRLNLTVRHDD